VNFACCLERDANNDIHPPVICAGTGMAADFPEIVVRDYQSLAVGLRAVQDFRNISNENLEALAGLARGHVDKCLGPSRHKTIGRAILGLLLESLGVELVLRPSEAAKRLAHRWEQRDEKQIRVSRSLIERCRPYILAELGLVGESQDHMNGHGKGYKG
jgi:hypothetical protein